MLLDIVQTQVQNKEDDYHHDLLTSSPVLFTYTYLYLVHLLIDGPFPKVVGSLNK